MKYLFIIVLLIVSCKTSHGIHNDGISYRHTKMMKEDLRMKKAMQHERKKASKNKFYKSKRSKKYKRFI